jgi:hypothetical protein
MPLRREALLLAAMLFLAFAIYWPGLSGDFFLDDYPHIVQNKAIQISELSWEAFWTAANSTMSGPLGRPLALVSFGLNHYFTALDPFYFKLTNLLLHLCTGFGIFLLIRRLLTWSGIAQAPSIALFTATLWLLHPLNVSTVLYVVQRMTGLAALFTIWGLLAYCRGRINLISGHFSGWNWILLGGIAGGIGLFAKETAILMLGYLLAIELFIFSFKMPTRRQELALQAAYILGIGLPLAWALATSLFAPSWIESAYANRSFTLDQRLLTESRVLWDYLASTWFPNIQAMGLYHDGYKISHSLTEPPSTLATLLLQLALLASAWRLRKRIPLFAFAVCWFYAGHSAEATLLPLEIKYEHRNYLPMLGMLLLMTYCIYLFTLRLKNVRKVRSTVLTLLLLTFSGSTYVRATQFGDYWGFAEIEAQHHPESSRANQAAAMSLIKLMMQTGKSAPALVGQATQYLHRSADANPDSVAPLFSAILFLPEINRQPPATEFMKLLEERLRYARLDANANSYFLGLLRQAEEGKLNLTHAQVHKLFDAIESNPYLRTDIKSDIIGIRAAYAQSIEKNTPRAKHHIDRAIRLAPDVVSIYVPAVWIYQEAGLWQDAEGLLNTLKQRDIYGMNSKSIAWLSQRQKKRAA